MPMLWDLAGLLGSSRVGSSRATLELCSSLPRFGNVELSTKDSVMGLRIMQEHYHLLQNQEMIGNKIRDVK